MKIGIMLPTVYPPESNLELLRMAEALRPDSLWVADHLLGFNHPELWSECPSSAFSDDPDSWLDPFCMLSVFATQTKLPLGVGVTDSTRRRASDVARTALTLQHLSPGGFHLGIGSGEAESLVPFGYPFDKPVGRCEEFLIELRCLLDTGRMPHGSGRIGTPLESEQGKPKVWVGGHGPRMLRLTGQYGDGWLPAWRMEPEVYAERRAVIAGHAQAAGRPAPECGLIAGVVLGESRDRMAELFERDPIAKLVGLFIEGHVWQRHGLEHPLGPESRGFVDVVVHDLDPNELRELAPKIPFELIADYFFIGSAEEVLPQLAAYQDAGLEHLVLGTFSGLVGGQAEMDRSWEEFARLRKLLGEV